jgi:hypothetical protein
MRTAPERPPAAPLPDEPRAEEARGAGTTTGGGSWIRSFDWRFLLPDPRGEGFRHLVLLGAPEGAAGQGVALGLARRVSRALPDEPSADAVVVLAGAAVDPAEAARCLLPGGVLYLEVDRRRSGLAATPGRVLRALRRAGLTPHGAYGVLPGFASTRVRFPLERPAALGWYLRTLFVPDTPLKRGMAPLLHALARMPGPMAARTLPCFAVVATRGDAPAPSLLGHPELPPSLRSPELRPLVLTHGDQDGSRVAVLPFAPGERTPAAALKLSRVAARDANTRTEQRVLATLRAELPPGLAGTVPEPLGLVSWGSASVGIESCVPGRVLAAFTSGRGASTKGRIESLRLAAGWLTNLHREAQLGRIRWEPAPLEEFAQAFGTTPAEARLFEAVRARAESLRDRPLPMVWQHWGFGDWNVYRAGRAVHVIDWEGGEPGLPLWDLLHFTTHWYAGAARVSPLRALHAIFLEPQQADPLAHAAQREMDRYMAAIEIDREFLPVLLTGYWVSRSLGHFVLGDGPAPTEARAANRYVPFVEALASAHEELFT